VRAASSSDHGAIVTNREARTVRRSATTFKTRRRSLSTERQEQFAQWTKRWGLSDVGPLIDWHEVFGPSASPREVILDIGFGHGESVLHRMSDGTGVAIVGVEVHTPGVAAVFEAIEESGVDNVRIVHGDAIAFLDRVPPDSLTGVQILFPDPWPKVRHHHRRLVAGDVVAAVTDRLRLDGWLQLATDIADYAEAMCAAVATEPRLSGGVVARPPDRPITRFEQRGLDEGRTIVDLRYRRTS
jgi:tRNA (guanine-N7-)-methyltransferase